MLYLAQVHMYEYYSGVQHTSVGELLDTWRPYTRPAYTGDESYLASKPVSDPLADTPAVDLLASDGGKEDLSSDSETEAGRLRESVRFVWGGGCTVLGCCDDNAHSHYWHRRKRGAQVTNARLGDLAE